MPQPPPANGHRGSWQRQGVGGNGEGSARRQDQWDRQDQVEAPLQAERRDEARLGEAAEDDRGGVSRKGSLPNRKALYPQGSSSRNGHWKAQEKVLVRVRARTGKGIAGGRVEAARAVWNSRRGLRQSPSKSRLDHTKNEENKWGKVQFLFSTSLFPVLGLRVAQSFRSYITHQLSGP